MLHTALYIPVRAFADLISQGYLRPDLLIIAAEKKVPYCGSVAVADTEGDGRYWGRCGSGGKSCRLAVGGLPVSIPPWACQSVPEQDA